MKKIAIFPGSFDPITKGHMSVVKRAIPLFDEVIVAIGINSSKNYMFPIENRKAWIEAVFADEPKVGVRTYSGLTVDFCKTVNANFILRGLRSAADFEFEKEIAHVNRIIEAGIETLFLLTEPEYAPISSSLVREVFRYGGDITSMVPPEVQIEPQKK